MRLDLELPGNRRRLEAQVFDGNALGMIASVPPPPPPDALSQQMEESRSLGNTNLFPEIPRTRNKRDQKSPHASYHRLFERRPRRDHGPGNEVSIAVRLRPQEIKALTEVGRFRVVTVRDLAETVYRGDAATLQQDLRYLARKGIVSLSSVSARRDGGWRQPERIEVVTLTRPGKRMVSGIGDSRPDQQLYSGLVKPREVEHDAQIYRAYLKEMQRIQGLGGSNPRVMLDYEIRRDVQSAIYAEREANPARPLQEITEQVARDLNLPYVAQHVYIPDARIEYELDDRTRTGYSDIEVVTAAYRSNHLQSRVKAGFRLYAAVRDRAHLGCRIADKKHMLWQISEL